MPNVALLDLKLIALELSKKYAKHAENRLSPGQIQAGDSIAYISQSKNAALSHNTAHIRLMRVKQIQEAPEIPGIYIIETDRFAGFEVDAERNVIVLYETALDRIYNRSAINRNAGVITGATEEQLETAIRSIEKIRALLPGKRQYDVRR
jgi:hypothetical protein